MPARTPRPAPLHARQPIAPAGPRAEAAAAGSASRLLQLLRLVGAHDAQGGLRLTDLIERTGYDKSTTHRALTSLVKEGFVSRAADGKRYRLGIEATQLALAAADHGPVKDRLRPVLLRVARKTEDVAYLMLRSGHNVVCLLREEGSFPVKTLLAEAGVVRPLGTSTVGVSLMAAMPEEELQRVIDANAGEYGRRDVNRAALLRTVRATRTTRYAQMPFFSNEVFSVGLGVTISPSVQAGIGVVAISSRMAPARRREIGQMLLDELLPLAWQA